MKRDKNKDNDKTKWVPWKPVSFPELTQSRLVSIQIHGQSELDWVSFWRTLVFKVAILYVCEWGQGGGDNGVCWWVWEWGLYGDH